MPAAVADFGRLLLQRMANGGGTKRGGFENALATRTTSENPLILNRGFFRHVSGFFMEVVP